MSLLVTQYMKGTETMTEFTVIATEAHLNKALKEKYILPRASSCLVAQAVKEAFPERSFSVGAMHVTDCSSNEKWLCADAFRLTSLYDNHWLGKLRSILPQELTFKIVEQPNDA